MNASEIDSIVQYGRGVAAEYVGGQYSVYRLSNGSDGRTPTTGGIISPETLLYSNFNARMIRTNSAVAVEQTDIYNMMFAMLGDASKLKVGDVLVRQQGDYRFDRSAYTIAQLRPMAYNMCVRTEIEGSMARSYGEGDSEQLLGYVAYQGVGKTYERNFTLKNGYYYISEPGDTPAVIPLGIQPYKRLGPMPAIKQPTTTHRTEVFCYVPLLPGLILEPGDVIADQNGNRYHLHTISVFTSGLVGYQVIGESLFT